MTSFDVIPREIRRQPGDDREYVFHVNRRPSVWRAVGKATVAVGVMYVLGFAMLVFYASTCRLEACGTDMASEGAKVLYKPVFKALGVVE